MAVKANLTIDQGSDFSTTINLRDDDGSPTLLNGYTGEGQMRKYYTSSTAYDFTISITANTGEVIVSMTAEKKLPIFRLVY